MKAEQLIRAPSPYGATVRVEGIMMTPDKARTMRFPETFIGVDGMRPAAVGYDLSGRVTGLVPVSLNDEEIDKSKSDMNSYTEMLNSVADAGKVVFGL